MTTFFTKSAKKWLPLILLALAITSAYFSGLYETLNLESLQNHKQAFLNIAQAHPVQAASAFLLIYIVSVALSLPVATLLTLLGGFLFGKWLGTIIVIGGATAGASIVFIIARSSVGEALRQKAGTVYKKAKGHMAGNMAGYMLFMRLVPVFPFFLVNIVAALFNVRLSVFVLTTFFGIIPGSFVYVNVGEELGNIESLQDILSTDLLLAFSLLGFIALTPGLYKKFKRIDKKD